MSNQTDLSTKIEQDLTPELIFEARERIAGKVNYTPVMTSYTLNALAQAELFFKCENFQKVGAFKARGATNAVLSLTAELAKHGVLTHSSGNHAAALARAAALRDLPAYIVMPVNSPRAKQESVQRYGGQIIHCEATLEARERTALKVFEDTHAHFVHPYNDTRVMAGQGTAALELLEQVQNLEIVVCPVGGGGLLSGTAVATKQFNLHIQVIGVEPEIADDAYESFRLGEIQPPRPAGVNTIADGLRTALGARPFKAIRRDVDEIAHVSERDIVVAMRRIWEVMKIIVEPSAAVAYAPFLDATHRCRGKRVGIILTGGNLDLDTLPWQA